MNRIYKYPVECTPRQTLTLPRGAKPISAINQRNEIVVYAVVDTDEVEQDCFEIVVQPTGLSFDDINAYQFLGSVALYEARYVFHIFYRPL